MNKSQFEDQIKKLRAKRLGKAETAKALATKTPGGAVKLTNPQIVSTKTPTIITTKKVTLPPPTAQKQSGCGCGRKRR